MNSVTSFKISWLFVSTLKYLGIILDDKLSWKLRIAKLVKHPSKSCGMLFKRKHYASYV